MADARDGREARQPFSRRQWVVLTLTYLVIPLLLLAFGRDLRWWQAAVASLLVVAAGIVSRACAERRSPGLLSERRSSLRASGVKPWDRVLAPLMAVSVGYPLFIVAAIDHRNRWSAEYPLWINVVGLLLMAVGYAFVGWAFVENRFFSLVVRLQTDRGHVVCDSGPYLIVRHPGYAGSILALPGVALALSSTWTLIPAAMAAAIALIRTALEDRTLRVELPGYQDYARRVRYRLIPGVY